MNARRKYRRIVCFLLALGITGLGYCALEALRNQIPDTVRVSQEGELPVLFPNIPAGWIQARAVGDERSEAAVSGKPQDIDDGHDTDTGRMQETAVESLTGMSSSKTMVAYSLFGHIPLKTVTVDVVPREAVYVGGTPIGIYLETNGVFVVETGEVTAQDGEVCCPAENIVKSGDYIQAVNGEKVHTKEELIQCIDASDGSDVVLDVDRSGEQISLRLHPVRDENGTYKAGVWVRNDTQGIGTLTYIDENGNFGALGHGISDIDTGEILDVSGGTLYQAEVLSIVKGTQGIPGELSGIIHYNEGYKIGEISANRKNGIFGAMIGFPAAVQDMTKYEVAHKQEVTAGPATILCSVDGERREYDVEIRELRLNGKDVNKGMVLEVTDEELLELTGGIVQGMSGSPILQNGRLVGAVTHVFVQDAKKGYGIFVESMLGQ